MLIAPIKVAVAAVRRCIALLLRLGKVCGTGCGYWGKSNSGSSTQQIRVAPYFLKPYKVLEHTARLRAGAVAPLSVAQNQHDALEQHTRLIADLPDHCRLVLRRKRWDPSRLT